MQVFDQIRTSCGQLPVTGASFIYENDLRQDDALQAGNDANAGANKTAPIAIAFQLASPQEIASGEVHAPRLSIEDLAGQRYIDGVLRFAQQSGPLFAQSETEAVFDWQCAMSLAKTVVSMQEVLNETKSLNDAMMPVEKTRVTVKQSHAAFSIYTLTFDLGLAGESNYARVMPSFPWFKKFKQTQSLDYAFMQTEEEYGHIYLSAFLLSFDTEISAVDFAAAVSYFMDDPAIAEEALTSFMNDQEQQGGEPSLLKQRHAKTSSEDIMGLVSTEENLLVSDEEVTEEDFPHIQRLVYALISLHLQGIRVDVFSSSESNDFMVFDTYLSYLWYNFAKQLGQVKIGYCEICGTGFSLTGHRGIKRRFCSEQCKTKAKNLRAKDLRDSIRESWMQGESVESIAKRTYPAEDLQRACEHVLSHLKGWKELQHDIDAAIVARGDKLGFLNRCLVEGIVTSEFVAQRAVYIKQNTRLHKTIQERINKSKSE